jgi:DNA-binding transcriptional ArsR family regulator
MSSAAPKRKPGLSAEALELIANRFRVLGEPLRLRLLNELREGEKNVNDLVKAAETSQANVSKHLRILMTAGLVNRRKEGVFAYYYIADDLVFELCDLVCARMREELERISLALRTAPRNG